MSARFIFATNPKKLQQYFKNCYRSIYNFASEIYLHLILTCYIIIRNKS